MAELSLAQAAALTGKSKSTIARAIKSGRLSAARRADGAFSVDPSELLRVYPDAACSASSAADGGASDAAQRLTQQAEINALRDDLASARQAAAVASALADERARALEAAERNLADLRRLLPLASSDAPRRRWWPFG